MVSACRSHSGMLDKNFKERCHWLEDARAANRELQAITVGSSVCTSLLYKYIDSCHLLDCTVALIAALKVTPLGSTARLSISVTRSNATCQCPSFSQALIAELNVTTSAATPCKAISLKK